jgi:hypothetical protein
MYSIKSGLIIGFHGCDQDVRNRVINGQKLLPSQNSYDWLGHGMYFWENNYNRALQFAQKPGIQNPSVLGAVFDLGNCLDLLDSKYLLSLKDSYENYQYSIKISGKNMPQNKGGKRILDCAVIENLHEINRTLDNVAPFDSVKGVFIEGEPLYEGAEIYNKNHIQICIRNPNCIKGFFLPRTLENWHG